MDVPAGVTQEEGHTGFLHLPYAILASILLARRIQPVLSLIDREVEFCGKKAIYSCLTISNVVITTIDKWFPSDQEKIAETVIM